VVINEAQKFYKKRILLLDTAKRVREMSGIRASERGGEGGESETETNFE
jgi:hypothetical protein